MVQMDVDLFGNELAAVLADSLATGSVGGALTQTLAYCADVAEASCGVRPMACRRGCPHCCVLNVSVLLPEAMVIAERIALHSAEPGQEELLTRLASHCTWARWMDDEERIIRRAVCPLLDEGGSCSVHPVRPLACRGVASLDGESCRSAFDPIISDQDRCVPADLQRRMVYDSSFAAMGSALRLHGLDDRSIELGTGILAFVRYPGLKALFLAGGRLPRTLWE